MLNRRICYREIRSTPGDDRFIKYYEYLPGTCMKTSESIDFIAFMIRYRNFLFILPIFLHNRDNTCIFVHTNLSSVVVGFFSLTRCVFCCCTLDVASDGVLITILFYSIFASTASLLFTIIPVRQVLPVCVMCKSIRHFLDIIRT